MKPHIFSLLNIIFGMQNNQVIGEEFTLFSIIDKIRLQPGVFELLNNTNLLSNLPWIHPLGTSFSPQNSCSYTPQHELSGLSSVHWVLPEIYFCKFAAIWQSLERCLV